MFPLVIFHPLTHDPALGHQFPLAHAIVRVEPNLSPPLQNPIVMGPTCILMVLNEVCFIIFNKCHWLFLFSLSNPVTSEPKVVL